MIQELRTSLQQRKPSSDQRGWKMKDRYSFFCADKIKQSPTFGLVADPLIDFICCLLGVSEVQTPALTLEVGFVGGYKGLLHGEALLSEHGVGDQHGVLIGLSCQGLVKLLKHLVRPCANQVNSYLFLLKFHAAAVGGVCTIFLVAESSEDLLPGLSVSSW